MHGADIPQEVGQYTKHQTYIPDHPDQTGAGHSRDTWKQQRTETNLGKGELMWNFYSLDWPRLPAAEAHLMLCVSFFFFFQGALFKVTNTDLLRMGHLLLATWYVGDVMLLSALFEHLLH